MKVIVIGAGFGGLSCALHLAKQGHKVEVYEKNSMPGGRAQIWRTKGYHFDMGPSWYLLPEVYEEIFNDLGEDVGLDLEKLPEAYKIFYDDKTHVTVPNDPDKTVKLFEKIEKGAGKKLEKYLANAKVAHEIGFEYVVKKHPSPLNFLHPKIILNILALKPWESLHKHVGRYFDNQKLQQMLEYESVFLGGTPYTIPALYSLVSYWDIVRGVYYPKGGFWSLVKRMENLCLRNGVKFFYNSPVEHIVIEKKLVKGIVVNSKTVTADRVVVNADYHHAETLLAPVHRELGESFWKKADITPSGLVMYLGVGHKLPSLKHHNFYFTKRWAEHALDISAGKWPDDPSYYVCVPSKTDAVAPKGKENVFVLVPIAPGLDDTNKEEIAIKILTHLEKITQESILDDLDVKRIFCVSDFEKAYNAFQGNAFGLGHTLKHSIIRPNQESTKVSGLFFTGQYTYPGTGVPMAVLSGKQVAEKVHKSE